jgi:single stranded DNA-binding protein
LTIVGNLGRDPEQHTSSKGNPMTTFSVAVDAALPAQDGAPATVWFDVVTTGKQVGICAQYLHNVDRVLVEGELQPVRLYTRQDGTAGASLSRWATPMGVVILTNAPAHDEDGGEDSEIPFQPFVWQAVLISAGAGPCGPAGFSIPHATHMEKDT